MDWKGLYNYTIQISSHILTTCSVNVVSKGAWNERGIRQRDELASLVQKWVIGEGLVESLLFLLIRRVGAWNYHPSSLNGESGGLMVSRIVSSTLHRVIGVQALVRDILLRSWARHFTLTVPLSNQVYKWVPANLMLGVTLWWIGIPSREELKYS